MMCLCIYKYMYVRIFMCVYVYIYTSPLSNYLHPSTPAYTPYLLPLLMYLPLAE